MGKVSVGIEVSQSRNYLCEFSPKSSTMRYSSDIHEAAK